LVWVINIDESKCTADGLCVDICPVKVLEVKENSKKMTTVVAPDECLGCMACVNTCENAAITVTEY
jgi:NAD-dependent dihydropyrimidine dehydrogenase PreA subunit